MRKLSIAKTEAKEMNEYELSLIIHLLMLVSLSIFMSFKAIPQKKQNVMPVTLVAQIDKPKAGAIADIKKETGSKKAEGKTNKVVKPKTAAPAKAPTPKASAKPVKKAAPKPTAKPNAKKAPTVTNKTQAKEPVKKAVAETAKVAVPVVAVKPAQTNLPSVISMPTNDNTPVKPTHNAPLFEDVSDLSTGLGQPNPILDSVGKPNTLSEDSMLMPESMLDDSMMFASPDDVSSPTTGSNSGSKGNGLFEVGSIEAFGGNNENFVAPTIISRVQPDYPDWARKQGVHGSAVYRVLIQPSGTVGDVITMSSTVDPKLAINGAQALRRWVFTPVLNNGTPQETWVKISVQYELN